VGALCALIKAGSFKEKDSLSRCGPGSYKIDVMGNRTCGGSAAKGTQLEFCMRPCVIMRPRVIMRPCVIIRSRVVMQLGRHARHGGT